MREIARDSAERAMDKASSAKAEDQILVVDPDAAVRHVLNRVLSGEGYRVVTAASEMEALAIVSTEPVDLALIDLSGAGRGGWAILERLAKCQFPPAVIFIATSSSRLTAPDGSIACALVEKPLDFPRLLESVSRLLGESPEIRLARLTLLAGQFL
jgi:CheY-like chemotaxis protein